MAVRAFKSGGGSSDTPGDFVTLHNEDSVTAGRWQTLKGPDSTAYQVPVGKTLRITQLMVSNASASSITFAEIGYGDDAVSNSTSRPTNPRIFWSIIKGYTLAANTGYLLPWVFEVPAGKYVYFCQTSVEMGIAVQGILY